MIQLERERLLLGDLARFPLRLVRRPQDARRLLHDTDQQVVDVVLQLADVCVLLLHHLLLLDQFLHDFLERQAAIRRHAALELIGLLRKSRAADRGQYPATQRRQLERHATIDGIVEILQGIPLS